VPGNGSFAFGDVNLVVGNNTNVMGSANIVNVPTGTGDGDNINLLGNNNLVATIAQATNSNIVGSNNVIDGTNSNVLGNGVTVAPGSDNAIAIGNGVVVSGAGTTAIGTNATATATNSVALGTNATATATNSVALGAGSVANQANTVSVGSPGNERRITNVAPGIFGTDAVNLNQLTNVQGLLTNQIFGVQREERRGIAAAMASSSIVTPIRPGGTTIGLTGGFFRSESAIGVNIAHRFQSLPGLVAYGAVGFAGGGDVTGKVGGAYEF
jgi:trimeric autotransporter adhesin